MQWASKLFGMGLLDPELEKRLSDAQRRQMGQASLMDAGIAMLANSGYSRMPVSTGQALAAGLGAGRQAFAGQAQGLQEQMAAQKKAQQEAQYLATLSPEQQQMARILGAGPFAAKQMEQQGRVALERTKAELKPPQTSTLQREAAQLFPNDQAAQNNWIRQQRAKSNAPVVNVSTGAADNVPFGKKGQDLSAQAYFDLQNQAAAAQQGLQAIDALENIFDGMETGKVAEVRGQLGQWLGTAEGADFQASRSIVEDRVSEIINAMKGPATDKDAERALAQVPNMGTDPRARRVVFDYIRRKAAAKMQNYNAATEYASKNRTLFGFMPPAAMDFRVGTPSQAAPGQAPANQQGPDLSGMTIEQLQELAERLRRGGQ